MLPSGTKHNRKHVQSENVMQNVWYLKYINNAYTTYSLVSTEWH